MLRIRCYSIPIQSIELIHPRDITDKQFEVQPEDILAGS